MGSTAELEQNKEVVRRFMTIMDNQDFHLLDEVWAPDMVLHLAGVDFERDQVEGFVRMFYAGFPDLRHEVEEIMASASPRN